MQHVSTCRGWACSARLLSWVLLRKDFRCSFDGFAVDPASRAPGACPVHWAQCTTCSGLQRVVVVWYGGGVV